MKTTTTTTKAKVIYFVVYTVLLTLLCALSWNSSAIRSIFDFAKSVPALFKNISFETWAGLIIVFALLLADMFYKAFQKADRRSQEQVTQNSQAETISPLIIENATRRIKPPGREKEYLEHREIYYQYIAPMKNKKARHEIMKEIPIPISKKTYDRIKAQGDNNLLSNPKFQKRKRKNKRKL